MGWPDAYHGTTFTKRDGLRTSGECAPSTAMLAQDRGNSHSSTRIDLPNRKRNYRTPQTQTSGDIGVVSRQQTTCTGVSLYLHRTLLSFFTSNGTRLVSLLISDPVARSLIRA